MSVFMKVLDDATRAWLVEEAAELFVSLFLRGCVLSM